MYAIQEPIVGLISGILGSLFFLDKKNNILVNIFWRIIIYGFVFFCSFYVFSNLNFINKDNFQGSKSSNNELIFSIIISILLIVFLIVLELLNFIYYKKNKKFKNNKNILFLYVSMSVAINIMLFSFILGPIIQLEYLQYIGNPPPTGFLKNGVIYLLIPRILKECIKTPVYIILLFSIIYAIKTQYINLLNVSKNKWNNTLNITKDFYSNKKNYLKTLVNNKIQLEIVFLIYKNTSLSSKNIELLLQTNISKDLQYLQTIQLIVFDEKIQKYKINSKIKKILSNI